MTQLLLFTASVSEKRRPSGGATNDFGCEETIDHMSHRYRGAFRAPSRSPRNGRKTPFVYRNTHISVTCILSFRIFLYVQSSDP